MLTRDEIFHSASCGDYRIQLCWPDEPAPENGWPVIFLLDGASYFPIAEYLMRTLAHPRCSMLPGVVVAIDYPDGSRREKDYRPAVAQQVAEASPQGGFYPPGMAGQSEAFLNVMLHEITPWLSSQLSINTRNAALFGHSYGGLFTLNTLFTASDSFRHYYASSPSVWWNDGYLSAMAASFARRADIAAQKVLLLSVGEYEQSLQRFELTLDATTRATLAQHRRQRRMVDGIRELAWRLQAGQQQNLQTEFVVYADQSHQSVPMLALQKAMMHHFQR
ncbi:alpha/beta hydrolase-fold protein [Erwiniaceae bacterium BAC15a-03b]|uniref:Alpha/beta hydrolase-fold protein n=1 Tax=Winslowiella arboricola TaxID=2978220 RepID=A0A9J6PWL4_9GAMM|nr:alpha/beta hydrolase-fold protein [Winslowiella arboricola]MCU5772233.1 alpha/beta hydrolase-fold protein [Winslowiella arboricola]MCU5779888.1 alpha/beta hydrolase-fold protein [Winslowiella arboricola]